MSNICHRWWLWYAPSKVKHSCVSLQMFVLVCLLCHCVCLHENVSGYLREPVKNYLEWKIIPPKKYFFDGFPRGKMEVVSKFLIIVNKFCQISQRLLQDLRGSLYPPLERWVGLQIFMKSKTQLQFSFFKRGEPSSKSAKMTILTHKW